MITGGVGTMEDKEVEFGDGSKAYGMESGEGRVEGDGRFAEEADFAELKVVIAGSIGVTVTA